MWGSLKDSLINDLKDDLVNGLWDGLINDLINDLMKPDSAVCVLLVKAGFDACRWFERWFER